MFIPFLISENRTSLIWPFLVNAESKIYRYKSEIAVIQITLILSNVKFEIIRELMVHILKNCCIMLFFYPDKYSSFI